MRSLVLPAQTAGRSDLLALWAGQSANLARCPGIAELFRSLVEGAAQRLNRVMGAFTDALPELGSAT